MKTTDPHDPFAAGLRAVAEDDEEYGTSNAVGLRLLAEVQAIRDARRRRSTLLALGAAAAVLVAVAVPAWRALSPAVEQPAANTVVAQELVTEFFPLTYSNVPARGGYVVRMQVPRSALAAFDATSFASNSDSPNVLADVVIGNDGLARAVRFVHLVNDGRPLEDGRREEQQP